MTWLQEIIQAFETLGGDAPYPELYEYIQKNTQRDLSYYWKAVVRQTIEDHSSDGAFRSRKDYFRSVGGKGSGHWGLRDVTPSKAFDVEDISKPGKRTVETIRIVRDTKISRDLKRLYRNKCQVCNTILRLRNRRYSEVHHLRPLGGEHKGPDIDNNMIVLCPNHHAQFDYGALAVEPNTFQIIQYDNEILGKLFMATGHDVGIKYLNYHIENIFQH